jgi:hypothetical protein
MKKIINIVIKIAIILGFVYVVRQYIQSNDWKNIGDTIDVNELSNRWYYLLSAILLMPINWLLESRKWQVIMNNYTEVSFSSAVISILCGVTCGLVTPARVGEFMGRLLIVRADDRKVSVYASFICSVSQNVVTLILGLIASIIFVININELKISLPNLLIINGLLVTVGLWVFYNHQYLISFLSTTSFYQKHLQFINGRSTSTSLLNHVLVLSLLRYTVYGSQYLLVLYYLGLSSTLFYNVISIGTIFLIQSSIPLPPIMGLLARGEIAVFILGLISYSMPIALLAAGLLWVINLICPALLGLVYLMNINIWKSVRL